MLSSYHSPAMLQGQTTCENVCHPEAKSSFPKTYALLHDCAKALQEDSISVQTYCLVLLVVILERKKLLDVAARNERKAGPRNLPSVDFHDIQEQLRRTPEVRIVDGLQSDDAGRLWGCIPQDEHDVEKFGTGICINADVVLALEATQVLIILSSISP